MLRELKTLVAVAQAGTFAAAGERIGLTQAAVSAQMQRLELAVGTALFDRVGRTARLNATGQQVLAQAQDVLRLCDNLGTTPPEPRPGERVSLGAIASVQRQWLPSILAAFHAARPACRTRVLPGVSQLLLEQVDAGELDLAIVVRPPWTMPTDLVWAPLAQEPFRLLVPQRVADLDWSELLLREPFIRYDHASFGGRQVDRFLRRLQLNVHEICELDELDAITALVAHGVGVAIVPQTDVTVEWPATVRAISLGEHTFHREIGIVHRPAEVLSAAARPLVELINDCRRASTPDT